MNNNKTPDDKPDEVKAPLTKKKVKAFLFFVFVLIVLVASILENKKPDACDCARILNVPTETIGYKVFPIANLGNEEYKKFAECQDEYAGPASAILECADK